MKSLETKYSVDACLFFQESGFDCSSEVLEKCSGVQILSFSVFLWEAVSMLSGNIRYSV